MFEDILNKDELAGELVDYLRKICPGLLSERYQIEENDKKQYEVLEDIAKSRSCLTKGGGYDLSRAAKLLLDDFRGGKLGCITLEMPPMPEKTQENASAED